MVIKDEDCREVWIGDAQFKHNGTVNHRICMYWVSQNSHSHVDQGSGSTGIFTVFSQS